LIVAELGDVDPAHGDEVEVACVAAALHEHHGLAQRVLQVLQGLAAVGPLLQVRQVELLQQVADQLQVLRWRHGEDDVREASLDGGVREEVRADYWCGGHAGGRGRGRGEQGQGREGAGRWQDGVEELARGQGQGEGAGGV
jgi:hypothetical protein